MRNIIITSFITLFIIGLGSCRKDFETERSTGNLSFSKDTVFLDTIFTNIGSSTYNLKVYNRSNDDIHIPTIALGRGDASSFRLLVDGLSGKSFQDIEIKAKDSIFIFVETTVDILDQTLTATEFLYKDSIIFDGNLHYQDVKLVTLVKDAEFIFPATLNDGELNDFELTPAQLNFTNTRPYVIYGFPKVPTGQTLTIDPGARIHFHQNSGLIVTSGATITANGALSTDPIALENEIIFEGDRLEPLYSNIPGQWGTIWLQEGSTDNLFNYVTIKNGTIGIRSDGNDGDLTTTITNTQLYNHSVNALFAFNGNILGQNIVANNTNQATIALTLGGIYNFTHCTFANYWSSSQRSFPTLYVSNWLETLASNLDANFTNCIIYGNENIELILDEETIATFNHKFTNCLIRFNDFNNQFGSNPLYDFNDISIFENTILTQNPIFQDTSNNNFNIEEGVSPAENTAIDLMPTFNDIINTVRPVAGSDIGAYQAIIFN